MGDPSFFEGVFLKLHALDRPFDSFKVLSAIFAGASYAGAQPGDFFPLADLIIGRAEVVEGPVTVVNSDMFDICVNRLCFEKRQAMKEIAYREALDMLNSKSPTIKALLSSKPIPASGWSPYGCIVFSTNAMFIGVIGFNRI